MNITNQQLDAAIADAIKDGDLPRMASLMQQKRELNLMLVGRAAYEGAQELAFYRNLSAAISSLEGEAYRAHNTRRNIVASMGQPLDKDQAYVTALARHTALRRIHERVTSSIKELEALTERAEKEMAKGLQFQAFSVPSAGAVTTAANNRPQILAELDPFGIGINAQAQEQMAA